METGHRFRIRQGMAQRKSHLPSPLQLDSKPNPAYEFAGPDSFPFDVTIHSECSTELRLQRHCLRQIGDETWYLPPCYHFPFIF